MGVNISPCIFPTTPSSHCFLNPEDCDPDCFAGMIQGANNERELIEAYTGLLQKRIVLEQFEAAKQDLDAEQREAALKALIATYTKEGNADSAWVKLNQLPLNNDENVTFYNLYSEILQGIQPPAGSGKTMNIQEQFIRTTAISANKAVAAMAEVVMNGYYNSLFNKNVGGVLLKGTLAQQPAALWSLLPNPTQQQVTLGIKQGLLAGRNRADVSIYNFNGTLLRQAAILAIRRQANMISFYSNSTILNLTSLAIIRYNCSQLRQGIT